MTKATYETEPCSRCGGSGEFSWCQTHGSRCFKCRGKGTTLTKRGRATQQFAADIVKINPLDVKVGDTIKFGRGGSINVVSIERKPSGWSRVVDGVKKPLPDYLVFNGATITHECSIEDTDLRRGYTQADINAIVAYQDNLTKAGTVRKRK